MLALPPEIWLHIITFIDPQKIKTLYAVNRTFFEVAMDKKYRHITINRRNNHSVQKLERLLKPDIACRVKILDIALHDFAREEIKPIVSLSDTNDLNVDFSLDMRSKVHDILPRLFKLLKNTGKLCIRWESFDHRLSLCVDSLWPNVAHSLRDLTIIATTTEFEKIIPWPMIDFPHLTSLCITIKHISPLRADLCNDTQLAMASFAKSFSGTLQCLSVHCVPECDMQLFYKNMGYFKHLSSIDINLISPTPFPEEPSHSILFVKRHGDTLLDFSMTVTRMQASKLLVTYNGDANFYKMSIPKLQHLSITVEIVTGALVHLTVLLTELRCTLQSLRIVGVISSGEMEDILPIFNHTSTNSVLIKLSVSIFRLDLNFLLKLKTWLPGLKTLQLQVMKLGKGTDFGFIPGQYFPLHLPPHEDAHDFVNEVMACQEIRYLELTDIMIQRHSCCELLTHWNLMHFFATCISAISSFDERGHMNIPKNSNPKPTPEGERCSGEGLDCTYGMDGVDSTHQ